MNIQILEHRAGWLDEIKNIKNKKLQNSELGFKKTFTRNNGLETDLRDFNGEIVISHDIPS